MEVRYGRLVSYIILLEFDLITSFYDGNKFHDHFILANSLTSSLSGKHLVIRARRINSIYSLHFDREEG